MVFNPDAPSIPNAQPYYVRDTQDWAITSERQRHTQALFAYGEQALFLLTWKVEDFNAGLVGPCPRCRPPATTVDARISAVYQQALTARCLFCYGTTYNGGVRAQIIRPALFSDADEDERKNPRGVIYPESTIVESTNDFRSRTGDYVFRQDGSRWQLGLPQRIQLRTGYQHPTQQVQSLGYARIPAAREDFSSVAYEIPPTNDLLLTWLAEPSQWPAPTNHDLINGPLIPSQEIG